MILCISNTQKLGKRTVKIIKIFGITDKQSIVTYHRQASKIWENIYKIHIWKNCRKGIAIEAEE